MSMAEDPDLPALAILARARGSDSAFLHPHHLAAARRIRRLFERTQLRQRTTMAYGPRIGTSRRAETADDITDMAADARKALDRLYGALPRDCMDVVIDICGFEKGLQEVESERGWPRRSAKLVLRIGLEAIARSYGLSDSAIGAETQRRRNWIGDGARPSEFG